MIILTIMIAITITIAIGAIVLLASAGASFIAIFSDAIVAVLIVWVAYKLLRKILKKD